MGLRPQNHILVADAYIPGLVLMSPHKHTHHVTFIKCLINIIYNQYAYELRYSLIDIYPKRVSHTYIQKAPHIYTKKKCMQTILKKKTALSIVTGIGNFSLSRIKLVGIVVIENFVDRGIMRSQ